MLKETIYQQQHLRYEVIGDGPAVVLVHGFGEDGSVWRLQKEAFPGFQLIIPDLPGSGASALIDDMSMEGLADSLLAILDQEKVAQCLMIGHSMGGYITLAFAERYANRLKGFGLFHSTAYSDSAAKKETRQKGIQFIQEHGAAAFLKTSIPNLFSPKTRESNKDLVEEQVQRAATFTNAALITYYESMMQRPDRTTLLKTTTLPILFILGRFDTAVSLEDGLQQCHLPALSYVHILEEAGHMGMLEQAAESNRYLLGYILDITKAS